MAERNQLALGDSIKAEDNEYLIRIGGDPNTVFGNYEFEIVGIYHVNVNQVVSNYTAESDIAENFIFISSNIALELENKGNKRAGAEEASYEKATFFVSNPEDIEATIKKINELDIDLTYMKVYPDDSTFQSALDPLQSISRIAMFMMLFVTAICVILLSLILRMWVGTRAKEMGILLSLGNSRKKIVGQFVLESILLLCVSLVISSGIAVGVCEKAGNELLSGINTQADREAKMKEKPIENPEELTATAEGREMLMDSFAIKTQVKTPKEIHCKVTGYMVLITMGILALVLILTTILSARKILKMKPKEILSFL